MFLGMPRHPDIAADSRFLARLPLSVSERSRFSGLARFGTFIINFILVGSLYTSSLTRLTYLMGSRLEESSGFMKLYVV